MDPEILHTIFQLVKTTSEIEKESITSNSCKYPMFSSILCNNEAHVVFGDGTTFILFTRNRYGGVSTYNTTSCWFKEGIEEGATYYAIDLAKEDHFYLLVVHKLANTFHEFICMFDEENLYREYLSKLEQFMQQNKLNAQIIDDIEPDVQKLFDIVDQYRYDKTCHIQDIVDSVQNLNSIISQYTNQNVKNANNE